MSEASLEPRINLNIGKNETKIIVMGFAGVVFSQIIQAAGNEMDEAIAKHLRVKHHLLIGKRTSEALKIELGSATPLDRQLTAQVRGQDSITHELKMVSVTDEDIYEALADVVNTIINAVLAAVKHIPAEFSDAIMGGGIVLQGGGGQLRNMDQRLLNATGMIVKRT
jgi:rod shape-determining protein MreB